MSSPTRLVLALITLIVGLACLGYAVYLVQLGDPPPSRGSGGTAMAGVVAFGLSGGLCMLAAAVALGGLPDRRHGPPE